MEQVYDVCVVGAGVEGSCTAWHLASQGKKTLLLEQFPLPHSFGASHGQSRIIRISYNAELMPEAYQLWTELEQAANKELFVRNVGQLTLDTAPSTQLDDLAAGLRKAGYKYEYLNPDQLRKKYPMLKLPSNYCGLLEPSAGILRAGRCVQAFQDQFVNSGGTLHDQEKVLSIVPGPCPVVKTCKASYRARKVVITAGPWHANLLKPLGVHLGFKCLPTSYGYWKIEQPGTYSVQSGFPVVVDLSKNGKSWFAIPALEYPDLIKMSVAGYHVQAVGREHVDPDDRAPYDDKTRRYLEETADYIRKHVTGVRTKPSIVEGCVYDMSSDENFVIDVHPLYKNIIIGAGFSGHGFKITPIVGKLLSELAMDRKPTYDISPFSMSRLGCVTKSRL